MRIMQSVDNLQTFFIKSTKCVRNFFFSLFFILKGLPHVPIKLKSLVSNPLKSVFCLLNPIIKLGNSIIMVVFVPIMVRRKMIIFAVSQLFFQLPDPIFNLFSGKMTMISLNFIVVARFEDRFYSVNDFPNNPLFPWCLIIINVFTVFLSPRAIIARFFKNLRFGNFFIF